DLDPAKAEGLATALRALGSDTRIETFTKAVAAAEGADGIINCTPLGMVGIGGTPLPVEAMAGATWAFDAVYTPADTQFLQDAEAAGLAVISGYELFFGQGVDAWGIFTGADLDHAALRDAIQGDKA
ncbi:shikimate dehydrogenase family protein, partial [Marinovum algicola]|uniref:shikimate dehydrogenase family protein n=2 Tax=Roseobacteraceae TaxID=2854170 RepID=UPI003D2EC4DF